MRSKGITCYPKLILFVTANLQCENALKNETSKFQSLHEKFSKEKATHLQALKGRYSL